LSTSDEKGWHKTEVSLNSAVELHPVPIASDGVIATSGVADGRLVPVLILDTTTRPDIDDMVAAHLKLGPGDVDSRWYRPSRWHTKVVGLHLDFRQPAPCVVRIEFEVERKGALVDTILRARGLFLQPGRPGGRLRDSMDAARLIVEVPSTDFVKLWDSIFEAGIIRRYRRQGGSRGESKRLAREAIERWRSITSHRLPLDDRTDDENR
jgi:hypothetical protein